MYVGTDGGVYYSLDRGVNWKFVNNLPVGQFYHVSADDQEPYRIYGGLQDNGSWVAPSSTAGGVMNGDWKSIYGGDGFWVQPDTDDPQIAYAEYQGGNMARVHITEGTSVNIKPQAAEGDEKLRFNWNTPLVTGAYNRKNLYTAAQYLYRSKDKGANWEKISPDLTTNDKQKQEQEKSGGLSMDVTSAENHCTIFTIAESPLDENIIWAGTDDGNLQLTTDGGKTWNNLSKNISLTGIPAGAWISSIEPSAFDKKTVYVTFDHHMYGDHNTYAAVSKDAGATWTRFKSDEFTGFAHKIKEDIFSKNLLFIGSEMGLFASVDGGDKWFRMKLNLPWYALVRDIQIQKKTGDLILATHGRGIIIIQDISPMRKINESLAKEPVVILTDQPMTLTNGKYGGSFPNASGDWNGGSAFTIPFIEYYLKERANSIQLEVTDMNGKLLQKLTASNRKGYNRSLWNQRMMPPKTAVGGNQTESAGFFGIQVLPGNYQIKLKVNGKEYVKTIQMVHDFKNSSFTENDRRLQYEKGMELFSMNEELALLVDSVLAQQSLVKKNIDSLTNKKAKASLQKKWDALEQFRLTLVPPVVKGIADLKRLRNEIGDLYVAVVGQEAALSNLQLKRIEVLKASLKKAHDNFQTIIASK
ncbi:MAG: WD40/YVTN/BNR-like repeat-containing protein, partial [Bacteroidota bacterium]